MSQRNIQTFLKLAEKLANDHYDGILRQAEYIQWARKQVAHLPASVAMTPNAEFCNFSYEGNVTVHNTGGHRGAHIEVPHGKPWPHAYDFRDLILAYFNEDDLLLWKLREGGEQ